MKQTPESFRWRRRARQTAVTLAALGLLTWLGVLLLAPLSRSSAVLVTASPRVPAGSQAMFASWPPAYVGNDLAQMSRLPVVANTIDLSPSGKQNAAGESFGDQLLDVCSTDQTLLLYLRAFGVDDQGHVALRWNDAGQSEGPKLYSVGELLTDLRRCTAKSVVLMLDVEQPPPNVAEGQVVDDFVEILTHECNTARPAPIWVLVSHRQGERPYASDALERSAFGYWLEQGLGGEADLNGDRLVGLEELHHYVTANVGAFVRHLTGGAELQTPILLACGGEGNRFAKPSDLVPVRRNLLSGTSIFSNQVKTFAAKKDSAIAKAKVPTSPSQETDKPEVKPAAPEAPSQSNGQVDESAKKMTRDSESSVSASDLLKAGWQLRDDLERGATARQDPRRTMPHLWRTFIEQLIASEKRLRSGIENETAVVEVELRRLVLPLRAWADGENKPAMPTGRLASLMITPLPETGGWQPRSFGMEVRKADVEQRSVSPELKTLIDTFERLTTDFDREAFTKFLAELPRSLDHYSEIQLARRLLGDTPVDDSVASEALSLRRLAELVAARRHAGQQWVSQSIFAADQLRTAGEWLLLDAATAPDVKSASAFFEEARRRYRQIDESLTLLEEANALHDECLHEAPSLVHWTALCRSTKSTRVPNPEDVHAYLDSMDELQTLLESPQPDQFQSLKNVVLRLNARRDQVRSNFSSDYIRSTLVAGSENASDVAALRLLRETPLHSSEDRALLEAELPKIEEELLTRFQPATSNRVFAPSTNASNSNAHEVVRLYCRLASLAVSKPLPASYLTLQNALQRVKESESDVTTAVVEFEQALSDFHRYLAQLANATVDQSSSATPSDRLQQLQEADRASRMIGARAEVAKSAQPNPQTLLQRDRLAAHLAWQANRAERLAPFAPASDSDFLQATARLYRDTGYRLVAGIATMELSQSFQFEMPGRISLDAEDTAEFTLRVENSSKARRNVWVVMDYDPRLISITGSTPSFYPSIAVKGGPSSIEDLVNADANRLHRPDSAGAVPSFSLAGSSNQLCTWVIERRSPSNSPTQITTWVIARDQVDGRDHPVEISRKTVTVDLPYPPLFQFGFGGAPGTVGTGVDVTELYPFPNRDTGYQVSISGTAATPKCLLAAYALTRAVEEPLPTFAVEAARAETVIERYTSSVPIATVTDLALPADGTPVAVPFPVVGGKPDSAIVPLDYGVLLAASDPASGRVVLRQVAIRPQHPSRYLEPTVQFDPRSKRIHIAVAAVDPSLLPEEGCQVTCHFAEGLDASAARRLSGIVTPTQPATMFAEMVESQSRPLTLYVNVDGYPRAFIYSIPRALTPAEIPQATGIGAVRVLVPSSGTAFKSPMPSLAATLEVDAPVGTAWDVARVEAGIDRDRDRELKNENPLVLRSDREIRVSLDQLGPAGLFSLQTEVRDFQLAIQAADVQAGRVNVLGHLVLSDRNVWSRPVEVVFDDEPPVIKRLMLSKGNITAGEPVQATVEASDGGLSGVATVEIAIDVERAGEFAGDTKAVAASRVGDRWTLTLDTAKLTPGRYSVLARAVDVVGNVGENSREWLEVVTPEEMAAGQAKALNSLQGYVTYRGKPMAGFAIQLTPELKPGDDASQAKAKPLPAGETDDKGSFTKNGIPPGSYTVTAEGLYANRRRSGEAKIVIPPGPTSSAVVDIEVDPR